MSTPVAVSKVDRLRTEAATAAAVRTLTSHPDVVALAVEKIRRQVDALIWVGILLGLAFTMVNVQEFAAAGAAAFTMAWLAAWLLDPMVSLVLIAVLRAEQITARYQVPVVGKWVQHAKRFAFAATYTMNTWKSWERLDAAGIVLHSIPPLLVYLAAEAGPILRDRLTEAVLRAAAMTATPAGQPHTTPVNPVTDATAVTPAERSPASSVTVHEPVTSRVHEPPRPARAVVRKSRRKPPATKPRVSYQDYLARARDALTPGVMPTPKWVQEVTGCSAGTSSKLARELRDDLAAQTTSPTDDAATEDTATMPDRQVA